MLDKIDTTEQNSPKENSDIQKVTPDEYKCEQALDSIRSARNMLKKMSDTGKSFDDTQEVRDFFITVSRYLKKASNAIALLPKDNPKHAEYEDDLRVRMNGLVNETLQLIPVDMLKIIDPELAQMKQDTDAKRESYNSLLQQNKTGDEEGKSYRDASKKLKTRAISMIYSFD